MGRLLVTGVGKSGTRWMASELKRRGLDAGHERAYNHLVHGEYAWDTEVSWLAAPYTHPREYGTDAYVVHLVRHPLQVIRSRARGEAGWSCQGARTRTYQHFLFAASFQPELLSVEDSIRAAALHWVFWNRLIRADERLRIEDVTPADLERWTGVDIPLGEPEAVHSAAWADLSWDDVGVEVRELAEEYGY